MPIAHIASLWSLMGHPSRRREWSLERKIRAIAAAGFDGLAARLTPEHHRLADRHGLEHLLGYVSSGDPDEFAALLRAQKEGGARHINVQLANHDTPPAVAVKHWRRLEREAERLGGLVVSLEVHRDTCTETPEKTYEIAERYAQATGGLIRFTFDFSHLACVKHLAPAHFASRLLTHPRLIQHSDQCHFRPFNGHHCQVPVTRRGALTPRGARLSRLCPGTHARLEGGARQRPAHAVCLPRNGAVRRRLQRHGLPASLAGRRHPAPGTRQAMDARVTGGRGHHILSRRCHDFALHARGGRAAGSWNPFSSFIYPHEKSHHWNHGLRRHRPVLPPQPEQPFLRHG
ncbi:MAG: hypothetical protein WDM96_04610 [Lacunisphaera sp.]